jgi:hypothetical protein
MHVCNMKLIDCVLIGTRINKSDIYTYCQTKLIDTSVHFTCLQLSSLKITLQEINFNYRSPKASFLQIFPTIFEVYI